MTHCDWGQLGFADHLAMRHGRTNELPTRLVKSQSDPAAEWAKQGGERYFGYQAHVAVVGQSAAHSARAGSPAYFTRASHSA